jgi:hypothetical protein
VAPSPPDGWPGPRLDFPVTTMGRTQDEDPEFFRYAAWAGAVAAQLLTAS